MHEYTVEAVDMAAVSNLRCHHLLLQADGAEYFLPAPIQHLFHPRPLALFRDPKQMAFRVGRQIVHLDYRPQSGHEILFCRFRRVLFPNS